MSWIEVKLEGVLNDKTVRNRIWKGRSWCAANLSSNGVLWKHEVSFDKWHIFYFAQPQDATVFRLSTGI